MKKKREFVHPSEGVTAVLTTDIDNGQELDTHVSLDGGFVIAGAKRKEFFSKLQELIDEYRV